MNEIAQVKSSVTTQCRTGRFTSRCKTNCLSITVSHEDVCEALTVEAVAVTFSDWMLKQTIIAEESGKVMAEVYVNKQQLAQIKTEL